MEACCHPGGATHPSDWHSQWPPAPRRGSRLPAPCAAQTARHWPPRCPAAVGVDGWVGRWGGGGGGRGGGCGEMCTGWLPALPPALPPPALHGDALQGWQRQGCRSASPTHDSAQLVHRSGRQRLHLGRLGGVGGRRHYPAPRKFLLQLLHTGLHRRGIAAADHHVVPQGEELPGQGKAQAAGAALHHYLLTGCSSRGQIGAGGAAFRHAILVDFFQPRPRNARQGAGASHAGWQGAADNDQKLADGAGGHGTVALPHLEVPWLGVQPDRGHCAQVFDYKPEEPQHERRQQARKKGPLAHRVLAYSAV